MSVGRICRRDVDTVHFDESVLDTARRMRDRQVGSVVVVDDMHAVGILTDRDLTVRFQSVDKTATRAESGEVTAIVKAVTQGASPKEVERRKLRPGLLFLRAAANAIRRGVRTRS